MKVVYVIFSVVGWAWLGVVGLYMGWRVYRERMEGVPGFPVKTAAEDRPLEGVAPATPRRRRTAALQWLRMSRKHEEQC